MSDKKNKKITVIIISIFIVLILLLVLTYAYFRTELLGSEEIVKVGTLDLVLDETSEGISLDNAIGISDSEVMSLDGSTFELRNNGNQAVDYTIYLDDNTISNTDTRIDDKYLKYNLNKNGLDSGATLLTKIGSNPNRILDSGTIEGKGTNKYKLNLWITDEVDGNYSGQVFSGKLRVEVSQARKTVAETLLADSSNNINTDDPDQTFITGSNPNNYIWYSGKLWRAVSIDTSDNSVKLVTEWNISTASYDDNSSSFAGSYMEMWLNDTTVDGFLGNLRSPEKFIKMDSKWNASMMSDSTKPPSEEEGGTIVEGAIGLLNLYEATAGQGGNTAASYLNNGLVWWTLTPITSSEVYRILVNRNINNVNVSARIGIRPSINLKPEIKIVSGSGTEEDPYRLMGDNDTDLSGTLLSNRYSGEYISFGTGENNLYRIVSHETEGLTKITSAESLKESGTFKRMSFGDTVYYSSTNIIGSFLNGEYLDSGSYFTSEQVDMIEDNTTWYLGISSVSYRLAKYTDINMSSLTSNKTQAKVGMLRIGELLAGQFNNYVNSSTYWTLTPANSSSMLNINYDGNSYGYSISGGLYIHPSLNLKSNVIITGGTGIKSDPFEIELG